MNRVTHFTLQGGICDGLKVIRLHTKRCFIALDPLPPGVLSFATEEYCNKPRPIILAKEVAPNCYYLVFGHKVAEKTIVDAYYEAFSFPPSVRSDYVGSKDPTKA